MLILTFVSYLLLGSVAGCVGALLGIGGGVIIVPSLVLIFSFLGFPENQIMHIAIGTSLSAMVINTLASTYFHHKKNSVEWKVILRFLIGIAIGAFIGIYVAHDLDSDTLQKVFGIFACLIGLTFFKPLQVSGETRKVPGVVVCTLIGIAVAFLANLLGLGGGFFMFPIFLYFHFSGQKAAGTSSATSFLMSLSGSIGYLISASAAPSIPGCYGYIYLPAFLALSVSCLIASFYGVKLAHSMSLKRVRQVFAVTLLSIGLLMFFIH